MWQPYFYSDPMQLDQNKKFFHPLLTLENWKWMNLSKVRPASFLSPHSSILSFKSSVLGPQSSIFNPQSSVGVTSWEERIAKDKVCCIPSGRWSKFEPRNKVAGPCKFLPHWDTLTRAGQGRAGVSWAGFSLPPLPGTCDCVACSAQPLFYSLVPSEAEWEPQSIPGAHPARSDHRERPKWETSELPISTSTRSRQSWGSLPSSWLCQLSNVRWTN